MPGRHPKFEQQLEDIIDWAFETSLAGKAGFQSAAQLAKKYQAQAGIEQIEAIERLFADQLREATTIGFFSGLGGIVTLPVTLPMNITLITLLQVRLSATVAMLLGYDLHTPQVKVTVLLALAGSSAEELANEAGLKIGLKVGEHALESISEEVVTKVIEKIGVRFAVILGEAGLLSIETLFPFVGGAIDATLDRYIFKETQIAVWQIFLTPEMTP
ncbi:MAG: EcsC family protein [Culicoidibacterales bacterium]